MVSEDGSNNFPELAPFDPTKKKKKKKTTMADQEFDEDNSQPLADKMDNLTVSDGAETSFAGLKKKKKKSVDPINFGDDAVEGLEEKEENIKEGDGVDNSAQPRYPWEGTERDYQYDEIVGRVFNILRENNPKFDEARRKTVLQAPQVMREGTKKTVFVNFIDICKQMHREADHVMPFILAELGTSGSLDGQQRLVIKGRFAPKNFERIIDRYHRDYVTCCGCKSADTILSKENRLTFLRCEQCGSARSVAPIKAGFQAVVGRRN